jgi:hypothetical protein
MECTTPDFPLFLLLFFASQILGVKGFPTGHLTLPVFLPVTPKILLGREVSRRKSSVANFHLQAIWGMISLCDPA